MVVISRRPRLPLCMALTLSALAACSLVKPQETPPDRAAQAAKLAADGRHADAAQLYANLAMDNPADHDGYELLSAEQWVAAGRIPEAKQALAEVSAEARTKEPISRALVAAEIALAQNDGAGANHELDSIPVPEAAELAQNYWYIRGEADFLTGHPAEGTRAFVERERYLTDAAALRASRAELFAKLRGAAEHGMPLKTPAKSDPVVAGWLQLGPVAVDLERDPGHGSASLENWRHLYPQHPGNDSILSVTQNPVAVATEYPNQIALLLPLSGRAGTAGVAVRDGFISAYLDQDTASRPRLRIYDVTEETVAGAFQHAMQDGASFVVGPLTKEDVSALVPLSAGRVPVLALNFIPDSANTPHDFYQFALSPEDEASGVARHLAAEGKLKGVVILPVGELGSRVGAAFADELSHLGGVVLDSGRYDAGRADFSDVIKQTLQIHGAKGEAATHRSDAAFVFVVGTPSAERLLVSQLKFHYAGDIPAYSLSDSFEPNQGANGDLDGLSFPDMPWMISSDPTTDRIRDAVRSAWPTRTARLDRLYAFGFDAYRLVPALRARALSESNTIAGVTGRLRLDEHNKIRRELDWSQIRNGVATESPSTAPGAGL